MDFGFGEEGRVFDFEEMADHLLEQGSSISPAEIHGCLSGLLTAGSPREAEYGLDSVTQILGVVPHGELAASILQLYGVTEAALTDDEFKFHPLMPDDETGIEDRTNALADWCKGFLAGLAHVTAIVGNSAMQWSSDGKEILEDISAIAQATVGEDEADNADGDDELEGSYIEIIEYLRFAVLNLYLEGSAREGFAELTPDPDEPLH